jgi:hypothetical protein
MYARSYFFMDARSYFFMDAWSYFFMDAFKYIPTYIHTYIGVVAMKDMDMHKVTSAKNMSGKANERCGRFTKEEDAILMRAIENAIARCEFLWMHVCDCMM